MDEIKHIQRISFPSAYVFNLDLSYKPGVHWVPVYIDRKGHPEYFDSFGRHPPREIKDFLCTYAESWNYNDVPVQELYSTTCGQFVVLYIYQRCSGLTLKSILRKYFNPQAKIMNDVSGRDFVKMHYQFSANQSSDILQHSQNRPTGDRWLKFLNTTIQIIKQNCKLDISK